MEDGSLRQMSISAELSTALRYIRAHGQVRPLFVDQVCIDQGDNRNDDDMNGKEEQTNRLKLGPKAKKLRKRRREALLEKSQQIGLMGDIYTRCVRVVAWLGESTVEIEALFEFLPRISQDATLIAITDQQHRFLRVLGNKSGKKVDDAVVEQDMAQMNKLRQANWPDFPHRGYLELCTRRWLRRVWIIQETCLPPDMILFCGRHTCSIAELEMLGSFQSVSDSLTPATKPTAIEDIPWWINWWWCWIGLTILKYNEFKNRNDVSHEAKMASSVMLHLFQHRRRIQSRPSLLPSITTTTAAGMTEEEKAVQQTLKWRLTFVAIFISLTQDDLVHGSWMRFKASNPRDYIYGLTGLASRDDSTAAAVSADYRKSTWEIYTNFTKRIIMSSGENFTKSTKSPGIDFLLLSQNESKTIPGLPSWVPDWSTYLTVPHGYKSRWYAIFSAGQRNDKTLARCRMINHNILSVKCIPLCIVDEVGAHVMESPPGAGTTYWQHSTTPVDVTIIPFLRDVRKFCQKPAAFSYRYGSGSGSGIQTAAADIEEATWLVSTGGHGLSQLQGLSKVYGLSQCRDGDVLGPIMDGKPLLGQLWDLYLRMDTLCTIRDERRHSLVDIGIATSADDLMVYRLLSYWWQRLLLVEALALYRYYRYFVSWPFISASSGGFSYQAIFQRSDRHLPIGLLLCVLKRHTGRRCFISETGHVGLVPRQTQAGDLVVVPLGAACPVVLRPMADNLYSYIGEAYCYEFMHGEAVANKKATKYTWYNIK